MTKKTKKFSQVIICLCGLAALSACGHTQGDRALSGAGIGAGVGALGSSVAGGDPLTGAVIGGAAGAATGAFTNENQLDLGEPFWNR